MLTADRIFDILIYTAAGIFAAGVLLLIVDAATGFHFLERFPRVGETLAAVNKIVWIAIASFLAIAIVVRGLPAPSQDSDCQVHQGWDGREVVC